jgi:hypothetical protein
MEEIIKSLMSTQTYRDDKHIEQTSSLTLVLFGLGIAETMTKKQKNKVTAIG